MRAPKISRGSTSSAGCTTKGHGPPFSFIFAQRDEDRVLIDTGFMQDDHRSTFSRKFGIPTWISPLRMLAEIGVHADAINTIFLTHAHFDHMGSIAEFRNAHIYIQKSELLSWYEAFALPKRFSHLTAIVDPDNTRTALDASIAHRVTLIDGDKNADRRRQEQCAARGSCEARQRPHRRAAVRHRGDCGGTPRDIRRLCLFPPPVHRPQQRWHLCAAQQRDRERLGATQDNRQNARRTRRRPVATG